MTELPRKRVVLGMSGAALAEAEARNAALRAGFSSVEDRDAEAQALAAEMGVTPQALKHAVQKAPFDARAQRRMLKGRPDRRFKL